MPKKLINQVRKLQNDSEFEKLKAKCRKYEEIIKECVAIICQDYDAQDVPKAWYEELPRLTRELNASAYYYMTCLSHQRSQLLKTLSLHPHPSDSQHIWGSISEYIDKTDRQRLPSIQKGKPFPSILE
jgi:hypothetical protein